MSSKREVFQDLLTKAEMNAAIRQTKEAFNHNLKAEVNRLTLNFASRIVRKWLKDNQHGLEERVRRELKKNVNSIAKKLCQDACKKMYLCLK